MAPPTTTQELDDIKVYQSVTVRGLLLFGDKQEQLPTRSDLTKLEGCFVDQVGSIPVTIWNEQIELVENKQYYQIENIRLRQYFGQKYLSSTTDTAFKKITENQPVSPEAVKEATNQVGTKEVVCDSIQSVGDLHILQLRHVRQKSSIQTRFCDVKMWPLPVLLPRQKH